MDGDEACHVEMYRYMNVHLVYSLYAHAKLQNYWQVAGTAAWQQGLV